MSVQMKCQFGEFDPKVLQALKEAYNQNANSFAESCNDTFDFKTCKRDNGTVYGIPDKSSCNVGKEVSGSDGKNMMTDARLAIGSDPRKLDLDVMQYVGPEALAKIIADNHVADKNPKQKVLEAKARERLMTMRKAELGTDESGNALADGLTNALSEGLANSLVVGEITRAQFKNSFGGGHSPIYSHELATAFEKVIADTNKSFDVDNIGDDTISRVASIINDPKHKQAIIDQLTENGITINDIPSNMIGAGNLSAIMGGMVAADGLSAREKMNEGARFIYDALKDAQADANWSPQTQAERDANAANAAAAARTEQVKSETSSPGVPVNQSRGIQQTYDGSATYQIKGKPQEDLGLSIYAGDDGAYRGEWSDGYKVEYRFGDAGHVAITSILDNGTSIDRAKWTQQGGYMGSEPFVEITSKNGAVTRIGNPGKKFVPLKVDGRSLPRSTS